MRPRNLLTALCLLMLSVLTLSAQTSSQTIALSIPNVTTDKGNSLSLPINLDNTADVVAVQFVLTVPTGVTLSPASAALSNRATNHTITMRQTATNKYMAMIYSATGEAITGRSGELLTVPLTASTSLDEGSVLALTLSDVIIAGSDGTNLMTGYTSGSLTIAKQPDLSVANVTVSPTTLMPGASLTVGWHVTNVGGLATTGGWSESVYLDAESGESKLLGTTYYEDLLAAGASVIRSTDYILPQTLGLDGNATVRVKLTPNSDAGEPTGMQDNNTAQSDATLIIGKQLTLSPTLIDTEESASRNIRFQLTRSGSTAVVQTFTIAATTDSRVSLPTSVTIDKGQTGVYFYAQIVANKTLDNDSIVSISVTGNDYEAVGVTISVEDDTYPNLTLTTSVDEVTEGESFDLTITAQRAPSSDLTVALACDFPTRFSIPSQIIIPAGSTSTVVTLTATDDSTPNTDELVTFTATAACHNAGKLNLPLLDNDVPTLSLELTPTAVSEADGPLAVSAKLRRADNIDKAVTVKLSDDAAGGLYYATSTVEMPAGVDEVNVSLGPVDNTTVEGERTYNISAAVWLSSCSCSASSVTSGGVVTAPLTVYDNDGPTLSLSAASSVLKEGGEISVSISHNTTTTSPLIVTLSSDHDGQIVYPATVTIPAGETSVTFTVSSANNETSGDDFIALLTAQADGYAKSSTYFSVSDQSLPDAQITRIALSEKEKEVGGTTTARLTVANMGTQALTEQTTVSLHVGNNITKAILPTMVVAGDTTVLDITFTLPTSVGTYSVYAVVNEEQTVKELLYANNTSKVVTLKAVAPYSAIVATDKATYKKGETVNITGKITGSAVANKTVEVYVVNNGYRHTLTVTSDASGNFATAYTPYEMQMGHFSVGACYTGEALTTEMASFEYIGIKRTSTAAITCETLLGEIFNESFDIVNPAEVQLTGVKVSVAEKPANCDVEVSVPSTIAAGATVGVSYSLHPTAVTSGNDWEKIVLNIETNEGAALSTTLYHYCRSPKAQLQADVASINTTMTKGSTRVYPITITNKGQGATGTISLSLPKSGWMTSATPLQIASLENGETTTIRLQLTPTADSQVGVPIIGNIAINCENGDGLAIPYSVTTVSSETGTLVVDVCDEWTYNTSAAPHVAGATVTLKSVSTGAIITTGTTNENGLFTAEVTEGYYALTVNADRHDVYTNNVLVDPGVETKKVVNLCYQAIEISYELEETEVEDQYEIVHVINYETNVPKPVVIISGPTRVDGDAMGVGEQKLLYFTLTNKGLIRSDNVCFNLPAATDEWQFEALDYTESFPLAAGQSVVIPVVLTHYPNGMTSATHAAGQRALKVTNDPGLIMNACMAEMEATYEVLCDKELYYNESAHRLAMKACATSAIINGIAEGLGIGYIGMGGGGTPGTSVPASPNDKTTKTETTEKSYPVEVQSEVTICDPCDAKLLSDIIDKLLDKTPLKYVNDAANMAYDKVRYKKRLRDLMGEKMKEYVEDNLPSGDDNPLSEALDDALDDFEGLDEMLDDYEACKEGQKSATAKTKRSTKSAVTNSWITAYREKLTLYKEQVEKANEIMLELLGDSVWKNTPDATMLTFWEQVAQADAVEPLSYEALVPYKPATVSLAQLQALVERLNETSADNAPSDDVLLANADRIGSINAVAIEEGYESMSEMYIAYQQDFKKRSTEESSSVCSTVTLKFEQQMVMTRQAFRGTLKVQNSSTDADMTDVKLTLTVTDEEGTAATSHEFQINAETLNGFKGELNFTDGWTLAAGETGTATVLYIPTKYAAPTANKNYLFGGTLSYVDPYTGLEATRRLTPVTLTVKPSPNLDLTYFVQRDIIGDDPLTEAIEPCEEAEFALLINNTGYGDATNVKMTTHQPEIIDNEKGLNVAFELTSSQLNGADATLALGESVVTDFGNIAARSTAYVQWWLTSSLLGHFTNYDVTATHLTSYGNEDLSLLGEVEVHELIRSLDINDADTKLVGFMTNDIEDADDTPDMLYFSDGTCESVSTASSGSIVKTSATDYQLTVVPAASGWNYTSVKDPTYGLSDIKSVTRNSDGKSVSLRNVWQTDRTLRDGKDPVYENCIHLADDFATAASETYTLTFEPTPALQLEVAAIEGTPSDDTVALQPIDTVRVVFNKPIEAATFTVEDITMSIQGEKQDVSLVKISTEDSKTFTLDFTEFNATSPNGYHTLSVQTAAVTDTEGFTGKNGKATSWIMFRDGFVKLLTSAYPVNAGNVKRVTQNDVRALSGETATTMVDDKAEYGSTVTLMAEPSHGYDFARWTLGGEEVSTTPTYECTALGDMDIVAEFTKKKYNVTITANDVVAGTLSGSATGIYQYGDTLCVVAKPTEKYVFSSWKVGEQQVATTDTFTFTVDSAMTVSANFVQSIYEQKIKFVAGWNWISSYLREALPVSSLTEYSNRIVGQSGSLAYDVDLGMVGNIDSISAGVAYKVEAMTPFMKTFEGHLYDPVTTPITLQTGWNWISYPYCENYGIADVITNADEGDFLTAQTGFAEYANGEWVGTLKTLVPGSGYLYKSATAKALILHVTNEAASADAQTTDDTATPQTDVDIHKYPNTMNVTAKLYLDGSELTDGIYNVYAMTANEVRGVGQRINGNYYITVYGDEAIDVSFVVEDVATSTTYVSKESLTFCSDVVGSRKSPYAVHLGDITAIGRLFSAIDQPVAVYSVQGYLLNAAATRQDIQNLPQGIYIIGGEKYIVNGAKRIVK